MLLGTSFFVTGFYVHAYLAEAFLIEDAMQAIPADEEMLSAVVGELSAKTVVPQTVESATAVLQARAGFSVTPTAVGHTCQSASNLPCEDTWSSGTYTYDNDPKKDWSEWAIFDGHAGPRTSQLLKEILPGLVGDKLFEASCINRPYVTNDQHIVRTIQDAFKYVDEHVLFGEATQHLVDGDMSRAELVSLAANMLSGSCALMALYDPAKDVLRVANAGDSRAVLGRWEGGKYVAHAMSNDHTGFNKDEVARLRNDHPGEDVVDEKTGRTFGIAVTRAFGDSRWKWSEDLTRRVHELFFGPAPRPNGVVKTPPYLTAEPEVQETKIQKGAHPDFLIMASDGLWDKMSNQDAVTCVQMWLEQNDPTTFIKDLKEKQKQLEAGLLDNPNNPHNLPGMPNGTPPPNPFSQVEEDADPDTYYDADEKCLKWRVSPKHFVVEDDNAGMHLIKNALGGKRRRLFEAVMTVQPPLSRSIRDDITVHVVFFGVDAEEGVEDIRRAGLEMGGGRR